MVFWTSICVTVVMLIIVAIEVGRSIKAENDFDDLRDLVNATTTSSTEPTCEPATATTTTEPVTETTSGEQTDASTTEAVTTTTVEETTTERPILEKYKALHELNNHMVGWIKIENSPIDYPVLEVEGDNDYYLHKDFYGEYSKPGQIIFDYRCDAAGPSTNIILHGHQMGDNTMFGSLVHYKKKYWFNSHPRIQFDTIYEEGEYEVFAAFLSKVYNTNDDVFKYYNFINADTEEEFNYYIENVKAMALYDTGITPVFGDELLALSTCEYSQENGRLVVVARKIKPAEPETVENETVTETQAINTK